MRITFPVLLGLIFVVLKLCNVINWSWWYVAMPFWVGFMFAIIFVIGCAVYLTIFINTMRVLQLKRIKGKFHSFGFIASSSGDRYYLI